jgi:DNA topoisomerase-1
MSNKLVIVESPNKCGKIKSFLGADYDVIASVGHIMEIPKKGLNIDIKNGFIPTCQIISGKKDVVKKIKEHAGKSPLIYLASDPDKEGSRISKDIYDLLSEKDKKKCFRISFNEITKKAIEAAIKNRRDINDDNNLVDAQKARQVLDRLIGYKVSPVLWFAVGKGTSAGRVQSIALKFICEREKEIKAFIPTDFWYVECLLQNPNGEFWAKVVTKEKENRFIDEKLATNSFEALKKSIFTLDKIEKETKERKPQPPFDTVALQSSCSSLFGFNATKTMQIAQHLYEMGKVSYIRSDSYTISQDALDSVISFIKEKFDSKYLPSKPNAYAKKSSAAAQEAHECIRPTHIEDEGNGLDPEHKKMYELIRDRFLACQMSPMIVDTVVYNVKTDSKHELIAKGQTIRFDGWSKVYKYSKTEEEVLPNANEGEKLNLKDIKKTKHTTQPPKRYNDGSLIVKMEADGIGRPSTRATIIKSIQDKGYVTKEKGKNGGFVAQDLGMKICDYLNPRFKDFFMDVKFTAGLEEDIELIADGKKTYLDIVQNVYNVLTNEIKGAKENTMGKKEQNLVGQKCTVCGEGDIVEVSGMYGIFYSCNKYPGCKSVFQKNEDGSFSLKEKKTFKKVGRKCPECGADLVERIAKKSGNTFIGCSAFPKCKFIEKDE